MRKPASREFLHVQLVGTNEVYLTLILSLQGLLQNPNLETILICIVVLCFQHNNNAWIHMCDECKKSNAPNVCHKLLSILWRASLFTDHKISGLPIRAKTGRFKKNCEQTVDNSPADPISSFFKLMVINTWSCDFVQLLSTYICKFAICFRAFLGMTFHIIGPRRFSVSTAPPGGPADKKNSFIRNLNMLSFTFS